MPGTRKAKEGATVTKHVGLDVHKDTIAVAVASEGEERKVRFHGTIANTPEAVRRLVSRLARPGTALSLCYEAGPCGYGLHRQLLELGHACVVIAPSMMPRRPGERGKTDRRDAMTLARLLCRPVRAGVGAGRGARGDARPRARPPGLEEGPHRGAPKPPELPAPAWAALHRGPQALDPGALAQARRAGLCPAPPAARVRRAPAPRRGGAGAVAVGSTRRSPRRWRLEPGARAARSRPRAGSGSSSPPRWWPRSAASGGSPAPSSR